MLIKPKDATEKINKLAFDVLHENYELTYLLFRYNAFCNPCYLSYHNLGVLLINNGKVFPIGRGRYISFRAKTKLARRYLEKANRMKSNMRNTLCALADCAYEEKDYLCAYNYYLSAFSSTDCYVQWKISEMLFLLGRYREASQQLDQLKICLSDTTYLALCTVTKAFCNLRETKVLLIEPGMLTLIKDYLFAGNPSLSGGDIQWELLIDALALFYIAEDFNSVLLCYLMIDNEYALSPEDSQMIRFAYSCASEDIKAKVDVDKWTDMDTTPIDNQGLQKVIMRFAPVNRWVEDMILSK